MDKIRHAAQTTVDAPKILASASATARTSSCSSCAAARIRRAAHPGTLSAPAPEPGVLHYDLKELVLSIGGHRYHVDARAVGAHGVGLNEEVKYLLELT